jgi:hypothetical protein
VNPADAHLTEGERHALAELLVSVDEDRVAHTRACADCAADVERIRMLMSRARERSPSAPVLDDLWPAIRARIESQKVRALQVDGAPSEAVSRRRLERTPGAWAALAALTAAAAILGIIDNRPHSETPRDSQIAAASAAVSVMPVADSTAAYELEAKQLLDRLELQRALLRPEAARALEDDLRTVDAAIIELKEAIAHDPNNVALRQLLASSYRQKVELLKRVENAG